MTAALLVALALVFMASIPPANADSCVCNCRVCSGTTVYAYTRSCTCSSAYSTCYNFCWYSTAYCYGSATCNAHPVSSTTSSPSTTSSSSSSTSSTTIWVSTVIPIVVVLCCCYHCCGSCRSSSSSTSRRAAPVVAPAPRPVQKEQDALVLVAVRVNERTGQAESAMSML